MERYNNPLEITSATLVGHNDLILDEVLRYLTVKDLKQCRLVNNKWHKICQTYLKKKSVIKLEFDSTEQLPNTPKKFLDNFEFAPLKNTFSGVRIVFEGRHTNFEWIGNYPPLNNYPYPPLMHFISKYGSQLSFFEMKVVEGVYISYRMFAVKNILIDYMPNIEHLRVLVHPRSPDAEFVGAAIPTVSSTPLEDDVKLQKLKKIEWNCIPRFSQMLERLPQVYIPALTEVIAYAPNLNSISTDGSYLTSDVFKTIISDRVSTIKEIIIDPGRAFHSLDSILRHLTDLGNKNLRLDSFDVKMPTHLYGNDFWGSFYRSLSEFVSTQKDCLKKFNIRILEGKPEQPPRNIPIFPKMTKLEHLEISYADEGAFHPLFGGFESWTNFFPVLKSLNVTWIDNYKRDDRDKVWSGLLTNSTDNHNNLQVLKVFTKCFSFDLNLEKCNEFYASMKQKFLSLKTVEIYDQFGKMVYGYKTSVNATENTQPIIYPRRPPIYTTLQNMFAIRIPPPPQRPGDLSYLPRSVREVSTRPRSVPYLLRRAEEIPDQPRRVEEISDRPRRPVRVYRIPRRAEEMPDPPGRAEEITDRPRRPVGVTYLPRRPIRVSHVPRRVEEIPDPSRRVWRIPRRFDIVLRSLRRRVGGLPP